MPLSVEEYVAQQGRVCPVCGCGGMQEERGLRIEDDGRARQLVICPCGASWIEVYKLVSYYGLETE